MSRVIVVGGGAAGMIAACAAAEAGHQVTLLEKNEKLGKKIYITGKGRCNVTNTAERELFFRNIVTNSKFLYSSIYQFDNQAIMDFLEKHGCPLKVERGGRVFPVSDHAYDVTDALKRAMKGLFVKVCLNTEVKALVIRNHYAETHKDCNEEQLIENNGMRKKDRHNTTEEKQVRGVILSNGQKLEADAVILACGGLSYPSTGSDGSGYKLAAQAGHSLNRCRPALVPFEIRENWCKKLQGLSLKNVEITLYKAEKPVYKGFGEMLFTHFGVSGPLILSASSYYTRDCCMDSGSYFYEPGCPDAYDREREVCPSVKLYLDLKPALDEEKLNIRLLRDFEENSHKAFKNVLGGLFPAKLIPVMAELSGIDGDKKVYGITREERFTFIRLMKKLPMTVTGTRGFSEAIITQGGIPVSEVNSSSMESRLCSGLYLAGEMLDIDALTGGFNLQLAWSTGHLAGSSIKG